MIGNHKLDPKSNHFIIKAKQLTTQSTVKYTMLEVFMLHLGTKFLAKDMSLNNFTQTVSYNF